MSLSAEALNARRICGEFCMPRQKIEIQLKNVHRPMQERLRFSVSFGVSVDFDKL